jgi:hypothetical protein
MVTSCGLPAARTASSMATVRAVIDWSWSRISPTSMRWAHAFGS